MVFGLKRVLRFRDKKNIDTQRKTGNEREKERPKKERKQKKKKLMKWMKAGRKDRREKGSKEEGKARKCKEI